jgi:hypothetical protein
MQIVPNWNCLSGDYLLRLPISTAFGQPMAQSRICRLCPYNPESIAPPKSENIAPANPLGGPQEVEKS